MGPIFDLGYGPFRWVCLSGKHEDLKKTDHAAMSCIDPDRRVEDRDNYMWIKNAEANKLVVGSEARILYQDAEGRMAIALKFNDMVRKGETGPIMIGRDHHDPGGTDSPFRETANILDGSNVCADMATHCFAGNAARGMSLVSLHNGGGTGIGNAINGGFGLVLDGSDRVDQIIRHAISWDVMAKISSKGLHSDDIHTETDCRGKCLIPGFVDPHTHMCFAETREEEFEMRMNGTPYLEILEKGGGILSSVLSIKNADQGSLYKNTKEHVMSALKSGTTSLEIKSGYGLDMENELKMLKVIQKISRTTALDIKATFLGAHAVPPLYKNDPDSFVDLLTGKILPEVKRQKIADFCDVFCEKGVFTIQQSRKLLETAKKLGFGLKIHADEVHDTGGAGLAADLGAISADHLLNANNENIEKIAKAGVTAVLLPGTAFSLRKPYARARHMIEKNLAVALATDCNPGSSYTESMPFIMGLAILNMEMTPAEALTGATLNSAYAVNLASKAGSLEPGKQADFLIVNGTSPAIFAYHSGVNPITDVYKLGEKIF